MRKFGLCLLGLVVVGAFGFGAATSSSAPAPRILPTTTELSEPSSTLHAGEPMSEAEAQETVDRMDAQLIPTRLIG